MIWENGIKINNFIFLKICALNICNETLHGSKNTQTEMTENTDQFWNIILSKQKDILRRVAVQLLHCIHNDQEETWFITSGASLMLMTPTPSTTMWNYSPYWGSFLSMNNSWAGCMSALGALKQLGRFVPIWSWLCGHAPHSSMLELGSIYLMYFVFLWESRKQGGPPFQAEQFPLPK